MLIVVVASLAAAGCTTAPGEQTASSAAARSLSVDDERAMQARLADIAAANGVTPGRRSIGYGWSASGSSPHIIVNCLKEKGVNATLNPDRGGYGLQMPAEQVRSVGLAAYTCEAQYPIDPGQLGPPTREQKQMIFEYLTVTLVGCVRDEGSAIDDIPSSERFMGSFCPGRDRRRRGRGLRRRRPVGAGHGR